GKNRVRLLPIAHVEIGEAGVIVRAWFLFADDDDAVRFGIGVRLQQDAVDQAEDRGVQAHPKPEAEDRDRREAFASRQITQGVANVLDEHGGLDASIPEDVASGGAYRAGSLDPAFTTTLSAHARRRTRAERVAAVVDALADLFDGVRP